MKIIFLSILLTTQAQLNDVTSTINSINLITQTDLDQVETDPSINISDVTWSFSSENALEHTTLENEILFQKEQWSNVNRSNIFWRKINDNSYDGLTYIIKSEGQCLRNMCHVKLKYNGSLSNRNDGCLSFILWTRGQPVGQLWIEEDDEQESFSQKIQLTNTSLRVEHSLKSNIKNLSIDARVLFRNIEIDAITLSNLNVNWKGPCPKHRSEVTSLPQTINYQSTSEDSMTLNTGDYSEMSPLTTNDGYEITGDDHFVESSTIKLDKKKNVERSSSFLNQSNIGRNLSLIVLFCLSIILSSLIYGFWTIQKHYRLSWNVPFNSPIQFLARRSIRSSTRSDRRIGTLSQICDDLLLFNSEQEYLDTFTTNSSRSTPSAFFTYF